MEAKTVSARDVLTPDTLSLVQAVVEQGSFAAAARQLGLVPSAVTYRIRQLEDALDVLLFDRSSRQARLTAAGSELLSAAQQLLQDIDAIANRVKRVATGWEAGIHYRRRHVAVELDRDGSCPMPSTPCSRPRACACARKRWAGTLEAVTSGLRRPGPGCGDRTGGPRRHQQPRTRDLLFVYAVSPNHPLAQVPEPIGDDVLIKHRVVAGLDSAQQRSMALTLGLLTGQDVFTVPPCAPSSTRQLRDWAAGLPARSRWRARTSTAAGWWRASRSAPRARSG
jgi:DNA-binding transcriptional LysR family regulator